MKASNLALRLEEEPVLMTEEPRLARAEFAVETNESLFRRPRLSLKFKGRHFERRPSGIADQGLGLFRVR